MSPSKLTFDLVMRLWPLGKVLNRLGTRPLLGPLLRPCVAGEDDEAIIVPVREAVRGTESVVLPLALLTPLIERASERVILNECLRRRGENCEAYPHEIGCVFLGDGASEIDPARGKPAGVEAALAHAHEAMDRGLMPLVLHSAFDAWRLGIPYRRMLAICFCCDCCCLVRHGLRLGPPVFWDTFVRLPGLPLSVGAHCTGCGLCLEGCYVGAISLTEGQARIGESCKGCGRCASLCPSEAITLHIDSEDLLLAQLLGRIEARTQIGSLV